MLIGDLFETKVAEKIDPVIKVSERADAAKLASEIGSYVVTPLIEKYLDDFFEQYTDTFLKTTSEIGAWISGYFGSGKSHLAKVMALLAENSSLLGSTASARFLSRIPSDSPRRGSIQRSLAQLERCETSVQAFNLNTLMDSKTRPLPSLLLSQYYLSKGYGGNLIYARVIEGELDRQGRLQDLHQAVEKRTGKSWADVQGNLSFFSRHLMEAASEVAPEVFKTPQEVERALKEAEKGELYNVGFLVDTVCDDLKRKEKARKRPQRLLLVLDETGQWIENDAGRLAQLQALIEEAAVKARGKLWIIVTTHGDMGSVFKEARALEGDMRKIEGRFRFKFGLTTENIELVLEDRLFRKTEQGKRELEKLYDARGGTLRGLGELANANLALPACTKEKFTVYYPFFPYQVHLIPEVVKSLRSKGGRGEQLSGSTRTLLAITQDILRAGRRQYLGEGVGALVSFDEIYGNLSGEGEVSPDVRTELSRIRDVVPGSTALTPKVAEVLFLLKDLAYIPRSRENLARLLAEKADEDVAAVLERLDPELERLRKVRLVALIGEEYEFLTGERRTFEDEVATIEGQYRQQDRERGLSDNFVHGGGKAHWRQWLDVEFVPYHGIEFPFALQIDGTAVPGSRGDIAFALFTPLATRAGAATLSDVESQSLRPDAQNALFFVCGGVKGFDKILGRYLATKEVIENWKGDARKSEEARKLAQEREYNDLPQLEKRVANALKDGIRTGWVVFRGASRSLTVAQGQKPGEALRSELAGYWPQLCPKLDRLPVRIANDQRAVLDALSGSGGQNRDLLQLKLLGQGGKIDANCPLLDAIRMHLAAQQSAGRAVYGKELCRTFEAPPYCWDPNAIRVGVAALLRCGSVKVSVNKKPFTNPADPVVADILRVSRSFDKAEIILDVAEVKPEVLTETRAFLIKVTSKRAMDETPAALSEVAAGLADEALAKVDTVELWAHGSGLPLPQSFLEGADTWRRIRGLSNPVHQVNELHGNREALLAGLESIKELASFRQEAGTLFNDFCRFVRELKAVEPQLERGSSMQQLLEAFDLTEKSARFSDKDTWKHMLSLKTQAALELSELVASWREQARCRLEEAAMRIPEEVLSRGLEPEFGNKLLQPLKTLNENLETITLPAQAAYLPKQADEAVKEAGRHIAEEAQRRGKTGGKDRPKPPRPVKSVRFADITPVTLVTNQTEWDTLRQKMDERVRSLLEQGNDVELL
jgi:hypothetical protein